MLIILASRTEFGVESNPAEEPGVLHIERRSLWNAEISLSRLPPQP
jgi:hypothetical protein